MRTILFALLALLSILGTARAEVSPEIVAAREARVFGALVRMAPPAKRKHLPGWEETVEAAEARYRSIASDIIATTSSWREASILIGIAVHESGLFPDVDAGQCYRGQGHEKRCDSGRSFTLWQMKRLRPEDAETFKSRRAAAREALARVRRAQRACRNAIAGEDLASYASGTCENPTGREVSRVLWSFAKTAERQPAVKVSKPVFAPAETNTRPLVSTRKVVGRFPFVIRWGSCDRRAITLRD